jgi:hypothetical protein
LAPTHATAHPVFNTPISGKSINRPALLVDVLDDSGPLGEGVRELYLKVQSSRFPTNVAVIFPINREDFIGCRLRFIQLPFEVSTGDVLALNLLDNDDLSEEAEANLVDACNATGYCLAIATSFYRPDLRSLLKPGFMSAARVIGNSIVLHCKNWPFEHVASCEYIIPPSRPASPKDCNKVTLLSPNKYGFCQVRLYFPSSELAY